ncbi:MAG: hypothetical protein MJ171_00340 [Clostridia bacterium]|nr:hypothetical protein [Clostridia bacterium]
MRKTFKNRLTVLALSAVLFVTSVCPVFAVKDEVKISAQAAMIYLDLDTTGEVLYKKNDEMIVDLASTTKLLTCDVALDFITKDELEDRISFDGKKITLLDLLYLVLLESDNDAAVRLAEYACEKANIEMVEFISLMNDKAKDNYGCSSVTDIHNPSGLYDENMATIGDLVLIGKGALSNELIREIAGTPEYTLSDGTKTENTNYLLAGGEFKLGDGSIVTVEANDAVVAGKTGTFGHGTYHGNLVFLSNISGLDCYIALMDSTMAKRFSDAEALIEHAKTVINPHTEFVKGETFEPGKIWGGKTNTVTGMADADGLINMPKELSLSLVSTTVKYNDKLQAPINAGNEIGTIEISIADEGVVKTVKLLAAESVEKGWILSKFRITNRQTVIYGAVIFVLFVLLIALFSIRASNKKKQKKRREELIRRAALKRLETEQDQKRRNWKY